MHRRWRDRCVGAASHVCLVPHPPPPPCVPQLEEVQVSETRAKRRVAELEQTEHQLNELEQEAAGLCADLAVKTRVRCAAAAFPICATVG